MRQSSWAVWPTLAVTLDDPPYSSRGIWPLPPYPEALATTGSATLAETGREGGQFSSSGAWWQVETGCGVFGCDLGYMDVSWACDRLVRVRFTTANACGITATRVHIGVLISLTQKQFKCLSPARSNVHSYLYSCR